MRAAAIYDIHGNLPALEAVLDQVAREHVDRIVVGGDVVCGPMTADVMERLLGVDIPVDFVQGNAEDSVLTEMAGAEHPMPFPEPILEVLRWEARELSRFRELMAAWPMTLTHRIDGLGDVLFCHATPRDLNEIFLESTPEDVLLPIFEAARADVVVCGHTHMPFDPDDRHGQGGQRRQRRHAVRRARRLLRAAGPRSRTAPPALRPSGRRRARARHGVSPGARLRRQIHPRPAFHGGHVSHVYRGCRR